MAVVYKPHKTNKTLLIGGQSTTTSTDGGLVGPFPKFSINREDLSTGDGTYLGTKFSIEITGTATLNVNDDQDITTAGQRQNAVMGSALTALQFNRDSALSQGGILEIAPYGGQNNIIKFADARLISVSLPEQADEEAGVQNLQYSFSFEAYKDSSNNNSDGTTGTPGESTYYLSSAEESWELSENDQRFFQSNDPNLDIYKTYTLTHTVSATGFKKYSGSSLATDGEAWRQAQQWVKTRLKNSTEIRNAIDTDLMGDNTYWSTTFVPVNMDGATREGITPDLKDGTVGYRGYNHVRSVSSDLGAGSYSVTETWTLCDQSTVKATHDMEVSIEDGADSQFVTVNVSATIQGLNSNNADSNTQDTYTNAKSAYDIIKTKTHALANAAYTAFGATGTLRTDKITESYGENKVAGTITYSVSFNDDEISLENAISENLTINYDNTEGLNEVIAKIPIIGKADGPVIQDMNTTTIKSVSVSFDAVMKRGYRESPPTTAANTAVESYKPEAGKQQSKTESWNPKTGTYNLSISWEYI